MYGPKGVGCLYVRRKNPRVRLPRRWTAAATSAACARARSTSRHRRHGRSRAHLPRVEWPPSRAARALRDRLERALLKALPDAVLNGDPRTRLPHLCNISFPYVEGESLIMGIKELAVSSGSACTSASLEPSYVLKSLGLGDELAHSSIRFSLGRFTTEAEVDFAADRVDRRGQAPARDVSAVGDGAGRRRPVQGQVDRTDSH
jgi:cysteine desulfurase